MSAAKDDWLKVRAERQPGRTALAAKFLCSPDSTAAEWERFQQALAAYDEETERTYQKVIRERYHGGITP